MQVDDRDVPELLGTIDEGPEEDLGRRGGALDIELVA
jgi:hypothetical protein